MRFIVKIFEGMIVNIISMYVRADGLLTAELQVLPHENDGVKLFQSILEIEQPEQLSRLFGNVEGP